MRTYGPYDRDTRDNERDERQSSYPYPEADEGYHYVGYGRYEADNGANRGYEYSQRADGTWERHADM